MNALYHVAEVPFYLSVVFIMEECQILLNAFRPSTEMIMRLSPFMLLMWCITLIDFSPVGPLLHSRDYLTLKYSKICQSFNF